MSYPITHSCTTLRPTPHPHRRREQGFSLVELMVVVAIVGILSAIALPAYTDYATRGKIPEATTYLAGQRVRMEQYFQDNKSYANAPVCVSDTTSSKYFQFGCTASTDGLSYALTATGVGAMAGFVFNVDQANTRSSAVPSGWTLPSPNNCWVTAKGGAC